MSAELLPCVDCVLLQAGSAELTGKGLQNLGAEEFYAWLVVNSNYGAGHVMG